MAVTAWRSPGTVTQDTSVGTVEITNYENVAGVGSPTATISWPTVGSTTASYRYKATNWGFTTSDIPSGATIDGMEFRYVRNENSSTDNLFTSQIYTINSSGTVLTTTNNAVTTEWPTASTTETIGGATNLMGYTGATDSDVRDTDFGIAFQASSNSGVTPAGSLDSFELRIYYTNTTSTPITTSDTLSSSISENTPLIINTLLSADTNSMSITEVISILCLCNVFDSIGITIAENRDSFLTSSLQETIRISLSEVVNILANLNYSDTQAVSFTETDLLESILNISDQGSISEDSLVDNLLNTNLTESSSFTFISNLTLGASSSLSDNFSLSIGEYYQYLIYQTITDILGLSTDDITISSITKTITDSLLVDLQESILASVLIDVLEQFLLDLQEDQNSFVTSLLQEQFLINIQEIFGLQVLLSTFDLLQKSCQEVVTIATTLISQENFFLSSLSNSTSNLFTSVEDSYNLDTTDLSSILLLSDLSDSIELLPIEYYDINVSFLRNEPINLTFDSTVNMTNYFESVDSFSLLVQEARSLFSYINTSEQITLQEVSANTITSFVNLVDTLTNSINSTGLIYLGVSASDTLSSEIQEISRYSQLVRCQDTLDLIFESLVNLVLNGSAPFNQTIVDYLKLTIILRGVVKSLSSGIVSTVYENTQVTYSKVIIPTINSVLVTTLNKGIPNGK